MENLHKIINLTPHVINVVEDDKIILTLQPSGTVARVKTEEYVIGVLNKTVCIYEIELEEVYGLPEPEKDTFYIVSLITAQSLKGVRNDILVTHGAIRDSNGNVIGCKGFARV
jgi:hypothetical protein